MTFAPVPAALFLDFDNVFTSLLQRDAGAAQAFVRDPLAWVQWLESHAAEASAVAAARRRILIRRCYLNPMASLPQAGGRRIPFSGFRGAFVRAGFQVVDCPPLTQAGKTSADMVMAMDILDTLAHPTRFGEFVIVSSDADFTPVLLRVRAFDRVGTIVALGNSADAYRAAADRVIGPAEFLREALRAAPAPARTAAADGEAPLRDRLVAHCIGSVRKAGGRMNMATLAGDLNTAFGRDTIKGSAWGGAGSFGAIVAAARLVRDGDSVCVSVPPPEAPAPDGSPPPAADDGAAIAADDPIRRIGKGVNYFPRIGAEALGAILAGIAASAGQSGTLLDGDFREALAGRLQAQGHAVSRGAVGMVVHRLRWGGLAVDPPPAEMDLATLRETFERGLFAPGPHCVPIATAEDGAAIAAWVRGDAPGAPAAAAATPGRGALSGCAGEAGSEATAATP